MATRFRLRLYLLVGLVLVGIGTLAARLYELQITKFDYYVSQLPGEKEVTVRVPGVRGEIKDRNGVTLATNRASYEVSLDLREIYSQYANDHDPKEIPRISYKAQEEGMERERSEADIVQIVQETVIPALDELGLAENFNANQMQVHYRGTRGLVPYTYRRNLSFEDFAVFAENDLDVPGVEVTVRPQRIYPYDALAAHILGYVKLPDIQMVPEEKRREFDHYVADDYGGAGVEKTLDDYLQGRAGKRVMRKDEKGAIRQEIEFVRPKAGADVYLTIDAKLQLAAERAMRAVGRGAMVVMDPRNGDILAMVSVPSYNPNQFVPAISPEVWSRYSTDETAPMINRAMCDNPPGSTFKIPIALAGCACGTDHRQFNCSGGVQYADKYMQCWIGAKGGRHGTLALPEAIKRSCNCFFYQYGNATGIETIVKITSLLGLGHKTGIPLEGESPGMVPSPQWLKLQGLRWSDAFTAMTSIGQGFAEATPLQMASVACTVANRGKVFQPRLVKKIVEKDGTERVEDKPVLKATLEEAGIKEEQIEQVKRGMWKAVNEEGGTAGRARMETIVVSGKTGTAQTGRTAEPTDAWFICFAPYDEPEYAIAVYVHNGEAGGKAAAPIAGNVLKQAFAMKKGYNVELVALNEAPGNFKRVEMVAFDDSALDKLVEGDEAETAVQLPEGFVPRVSTSNVQTHSPTIYRKADQRGSVRYLFQETPLRARRFFAPDRSTPWKARRLFPHR